MLIVSVPVAEPYPRRLHAGSSGIARSHTRWRAGTGVGGTPHQWPLVVRTAGSWAIADTEPDRPAVGAARARRRACARPHDHRPGARNRWSNAAGCAGV